MSLVLLLFILKLSNTIWFHCSLEAYHWDNECQVFENITTQKPISNWSVAFHPFECSCKSKSNSCWRFPLRKFSMRPDLNIVPASSNIWWMWKGSESRRNGCWSVRNGKQWFYWLRNCTWIVVVCGFAKSFAMFELHFTGHNGWLIVWEVPTHPSNIFFHFSRLFLSHIFLT